MNIKVLASGSSGNCYLIDDGETSLLLDAGIPIKKIRIGCNFKMRDISGCLITHCHRDHSKAVKDLLAASIPIWMSEKEIEALKLKKHHNLHHLNKENSEVYDAFPIGTLNVLPFRIEHDTPEPVGYLIGSVKTGEKLLYFTDTFYVHWRFIGITHIIGECNYDRDTMWDRVNSGKTPEIRAKRLFHSHMSLDNFIDFLKENDMSRLEQIYICHMSDEHGNESVIKEAVQRITGVEVYVC